MPTPRSSITLYATIEPSEVREMIETLDIPKRQREDVITSITKIIDVLLDVDDEDDLSSYVKWVDGVAYVDDELGRFGLATSHSDAYDKIAEALLDENDNCVIDPEVIFDMFFYE